MKYYRFRKGFNLDKNNNSFFVENNIIEYDNI